MELINMYNFLLSFKSVKTVYIRNNSLFDELFFWQRVKPAVIVPRYDMLTSISYYIYFGQDLNLDQDLGHDLHPPNISWIHDVNKTCLLYVTK